MSCSICRKTATCGGDVSSPTIKLLRHRFALKSQARIAPQLGPGRKQPPLIFDDVYWEAKKRLDEEEGRLRRDDNA